MSAVQTTGPVQVPPSFFKNLELPEPLGASPGGSAGPAFPSTITGLRVFVEGFSGLFRGPPQLQGLATSLVSTRKLLGLCQPLRTFSVHKWKNVVVDQDGPN